MGWSKETKQNWAGPENFDFYFCVILGRPNRSFISEMETGH